MITVVLNGYRRPDNLAIQLDAIEKQTVKPDKILIWQNNGGVEFDPKLGEKYMVSKCSENLGVWARFTYALNARTEYVCVFDDDTIPAPKWFENCLNTMKTHEGLLGTIGVRFQTLNSYQPIIRYGWSDNHNNDVVEVDTVGHSWFFKREWLSYFWRELPEETDSLLVGEDMHFTHMLQKYGNIKTYVPPHPITDKNLWGSNYEQGWKMGTDQHAISRNMSHLNTMNQAYVNKINKGFIPIKFRK